MKLEICAANLDSALAAQQAGADRIELCAALSIGGLTPSLGLIKSTLKHLSIPVNVLIRPRAGDFVYKNAEVDLMCNDIEQCSLLGVHGVVIGALTRDGRVDIDAINKMRDAAKGMELTFHRAIDTSNNPLECLNQVIELNFHRILSAGGHVTAWEGRAVLKEMVNAADGRVSIMPGGGINPDNIEALALETGATEFHMSAKTKKTSQAKALPGLSADYEVSDEMVIRQARLALINQMDKLKA